MIETMFLQVTKRADEVRAGDELVLHSAFGVIHPNNRGRVFDVKPTAGRVEISFGAKSSEQTWIDLRPDALVSVWMRLGGIDSGPGVLAWEART